MIFFNVIIVLFMLKILCHVSSFPNVLAMTEINTHEVPNEVDFPFGR